MNALQKQLDRSIKMVPGVGALASRIARAVRGKSFKGSTDYWIRRYENHGNSGAGSYHHLAEFKSEFLNAFVVKHNVESVIEYGCGDGNQLTLANYPQYTGLDVSEVALLRCRDLFHQDSTKTFKAMSDYAGEIGEMALSLDVIYHLVEDDLFESYMYQLFGSATQYVIIYSSNIDEKVTVPHVRHRCFTGFVAEHFPDWTLTVHVPNKYPASVHGGSPADFYVYERRLPRG